MIRLVNSCFDEWGGILSEEKSCFESLTDEALVSLAQNGDTLALDALVRRFMIRKPKLVKAGYLDSDDLLQEGMLGFISAVRNYSAEKGVPFSAYASVCINNGVYSAARKTKGEPVFEQGVDITNVNTEVINPLNKIEDGEELSFVLFQCENNLSKLERSVVFCQMSGLSYEESSKKLGVTVKQIDNALQRARKKLKRILD